MATVFVVGHRGMLGHVVARHLAERGHRVLTSPARYAAGARDPLVEAVRDSRAAWVVNCLGRIWQKSTDPAELHRANALFPIHLGERLHAEQRLLHASTDCVFAGRRGGYRVDDERDAEDIYGVSKLLGEAVARRPRTTVVRTSIVGPERPDAAGAGKGLLAWFLSQPEGEPLRGFTNHRWNGITTLEWAKLADELIAAADRGAALPSVIQPATEVVTKYELLCRFRQAFDTAHVIDPVAAAEGADRSLVPTHPRAPIEAQLAELSAWHASRATVAS